MRRLLAVGTVLAIFLQAGLGWACIHTMDETAAEAPANAFQAAILHDGTNETLIWQVGVDAATDKLAWVVPVPTPPDQYDVAPENFFNLLEKFVAVTETSKAVSKSRGVRRSDSATVAKVIELPNANAGPYTFQPLAIQGEGGADALNSWLEIKGFQKIDPKRLEYYAERNWTFLVVRVDAREGELGEGNLPPIKIRFKTPVPVVPFKLMTPKNKMPARVYVMSNAGYEEDAFKQAVKKQRFRLPLDPRKGPKWGIGDSSLKAGQMSFYISQSPENLQTVFRDVFGSEANRAFVYTLVHDGLTSRDVGRWKEDFYIGPAGKKLTYDVVDPDAAIPAAKTIGSSAPEPFKPAVIEEPDMGTTEADAGSADGEAPSGINPSDEELDYTLVAGVVALAFFLIAIVGVNLRRFR